MVVIPIKYANHLGSKVKSIAAMGAGLGDSKHQHGWQADAVSYEKLFFY